MAHISIFNFNFCEDVKIKRKNFPTIRDYSFTFCVD